MKIWFANLKFRYKLLIGMITITTIALLLISQLSYSYFYRKNTREVMQKADNSVQMASSVLSTQFRTFSAAANQLLAKAPFPQMISDINNGSFTGYANYFSDAIELTDPFLQTQDMVNNVLICGKENILFSPTALGSSGGFANLFDENIWEDSGITVFPTRHNSMSKQGDTIPISYPVSYKQSTTKLSFQDIEGTQQARFILLLDTAQIRSYFDRMSNSYTYCMYLTDENGTPLDIVAQDYSDAFLSKVQTWVKNTDGIDTGEIDTGEDLLFLSTAPISFCNLKVVHLTKNSALTGDIKELRSFFALVWIACSLTAGLLAFALSHLLTRRIKVLSSIISQINHTAYAEKIIFLNSDEISLLGSQLNQMYDTIQFQLEQIKVEEQKKAQAEIQMMSEQINPHFLYNTLECIHFQVLNGHSETAGSMLESLGRYLRVTLSVGKAFIFVGKEVEHATSYMEIMNRHSSSGIRFSTHVDSVLMNYNIMKNILQPLVENSIKHGFGDAVTEFGPVSPRITISITLESDCTIRIEVSDNGKGMDIVKTNACLTNDVPNGENHFGLHNLHKRLKTCYGESASLSCSSIPYLKNSIIIKIPYVE